jgi:hypothetical protein
MKSLHLNDQVNEDEMGMAFNMNVGKEESIYDIDEKARRKRALRSSIHKWVHNIKVVLRDIELGCMDWINLTLDMDQRRALANTVMNFEFHKIFGSSLVAAQPAASQEILSSIKSVPLVFAI